MTDHKKEPLRIGIDTPDGAKLSMEIPRETAREIVGLFTGREAKKREVQNKDTTPLL